MWGERLNTVHIKGSITCSYPVEKKSLFTKRTVLLTSLLLIQSKQKTYNVVHTYSHTTANPPMKSIHIHTHTCIQ